MDALKYRYQRLPEDDFIRILEIDIPVNDNQPVCSFKTIRLSAGTDEYSAISYTWCDRTPVRYIPCSDGQTLGLSKTVSGLLDALLTREKSVTVFIDALCINQNDLEEKARQVQLIDKVYSRAKRVIIWLGESDEQSRTAFGYMRERSMKDSVSSNRSSDFDENHPVDDEDDASTDDSTYSRAEVEVFMSLLERRWFQRVWIVQEVILGSNILVVCGEDTIDYDTFESSILLLWNCDESVDFFDIRHPSYLGFRCVTRLFALRHEFYNDGNIPLESLFEAIFYYSATDTRDFVFAIRGITDSVKFLPSPDYTASVESVFEHTAENIFCHGPSLDALALAGLGPRAQDEGFREYCGQAPIRPAVQLPSWVPDFRLITYDEPMLVCNKGRWNAGGSLRQQPSRSDDGLRVNGMILDKVVRAGNAIDTMEYEDLRESLDDILDIVNVAMDNLTPDERSDAIWRTLVMNLDMDEFPAPAQLGLSYQEFFQAMRSDQSWEDVKRNEFYRIIRVRTDSWSAFATSKGLFGVTWPVVEEDDLLCLIPGCRFPLIIRPVNARSSSYPGEIRGALIGWCYVHDIMHGEAIQGQTEARIILE